MNILKLLRWIATLCGLAAALLFAKAYALPAPPLPPADPVVALAARHQALAGELAQSPFGLPLVVRSMNEGARAEGEIVGMVPHSFATFAAAFAAPHAFCDAAMLHPNVKGCTHARVAGEERVLLNAGRKHYEPAESVYTQTFVASTQQLANQYLRVVLRAEEGPLDTRDYVFTLEAMPVGDATFIAVRYGYSASFASRTATAGYLATSGSGRMGFSTTAAGTPARGVRGMVERNAMRHYLALTSVLDTRDVSEVARSAARLDRYYTLTDRFAAQLREFERGEYIAIKTRELSEQRARDLGMGRGS
ncbi:MAG: hypothetical protein ABIO63_13720 [Casimicrobiaceae bacterium]